MVATAVAQSRPAKQSPAAPSFDDWPYDALQDFVVRMAGHGQLVSTRLMAGNAAYAVQQLAQAHALGDPPLSELALALFRHFERQRSGIAWRS